MSHKTMAALAVIGVGTMSTLATAQTTGPIIDSVTVRTVMQRYETVYPDFHFSRPKRNRSLHPS